MREQGESGSTLARSDDWCQGDDDEDGQDPEQDDPDDTARHRSLRARFDREGTSLAIVVSWVEAHVKIALTLSADPSWAVQMREAVVTRSRQQVRRRLLREMDQLGGQPQRPEPRTLPSALTNQAKTRET